MRRIGFALLGALALASVLALATTAIAREDDHKDREGRTILEFDTMSTVQGPYVGAANPIRGINGGGIPWEITAAEGELSSNGKLEVRVVGLVLATTHANPVATFKATVSCQSIVAGAAAVVNVSTDPVPATQGPAAAGGGNARIEAQLSLPHPCIGPIVFVGNAGGAWFAATGIN
jgi:hypothetical protein